MFKGTTSGIKDEWEAHNLAYYGLVIFDGDNDALINAAKIADIGPTVFNNPNNDIGKLVIGFNIYSSPLATLIDYFIYRRNF